MNNEKERKENPPEFSIFGMTDVEKKKEFAI